MDQALLERFQQAYKDLDLFPLHPIVVDLLKQKHLIE